MMALPREQYKRLSCTARDFWHHIASVSMSNARKRSKRQLMPTRNDSHHDLPWLFV